MRLAFIQTLTKLARKNERIMLLTGDLGFTVLEGFAQEFPERFINCGVAEANMIGVAAGFAHEGFIPFVYSIAPFAILRPLEQIRNDVCFHDLPVKIVGVGGGLAYGHAGSTHHTLEDIAIMCSLANMTVIVPADSVETQHLVQAAINHPGPMYIRLGKAGEQIVHTRRANFRLGKGYMIVQGREVAILACGSMVAAAMAVRGLLAKREIDATVISMHTIKPIDRIYIQKLVTTHKLVVTLEEHSIISGLGSAIAEVLFQDKNVYHQRIGIEDCYVTHVGSQRHLHNIHNLSVEKIVKRIIQFMKLKATT